MTRSPGDADARWRPDPMRRAWAAVVLLGVVLLALAHRRGGAAHPLPGAMTLVGLVLVGLAAWLAGRRMGICLGRASTAGGFLAAFAAWAWARTEGAACPPENAADLVTLLVAPLVFWFGFFIVRGASAWSDRCRGEWAVCAYVALLGLAAALVGIAQHHYYFPRHLAELQADPAFADGGPINLGILYTLRLGRVGAWFGNPNVLCGFLAMCFPAAFVWLGRRGWTRWAAAAAMGAMLYAAWLTRSTGGTIVLVLSAAGCVAVALLRARRGAGVAAMLLAGIFLAGAAGGEARSLKTARERVYYLRTGLAIWGEHPILGHGVGGYARRYPAQRIAGAGETQYAHNFAMQLAAETGLVGLALFGAFLWALGVRVVRGGWARPRLALAWACGLFLLDSLGDLTFHHREVFWDFALMAGALCAGDAHGAAVRRGKAFRTMGFVAAAGLVVLGVIAVGMPDQMARHHALAADEAIALAARLPAERMTLLDEAVAHCEKGLRFEPDSARLYQKRATVLAMAGRRQEALADLSRAAALRPDSASVRAQWADVLWRMGRRDEALGRLQEAVARYPLKSAYHVQMARYLGAMGRASEALDAARRAAETAFQPHEREEARKALMALSD